MPTLELRIYPDPILRQPCEKVETFDKKLADFVSELIATMDWERGIGLAAPQVGDSRCVIIARQMVDTEHTDAPPIVLVNPVVSSRSKDTWEYEEGCLSIPGINSLVIRAKTIQVDYDDVEGNHQQLAAEGMFARVLQHEIDHLSGRLFIDYLSTAAKSLIKPRLKQLAEEQGS